MRVLCAWWATMEAPILAASAAVRTSHDGDGHEHVDYGDGSGGGGSSDGGEDGGDDEADQLW